MSTLEDRLAEALRDTKWRFIGFAGSTSYGKRQIRCLCECGNERTVHLSNVLSGKSKSCGCSRDAHGEYKSPEFRVWSGMIQRCTNPKSKTFPRYGGRGIKVCDRWMQSFPAFLLDIGRRPSCEYSIERINNDGDYEPGNVRWATRMEQVRNTRRNVMLTLNGITKCLADWDDTLNLKRGGVDERLRLGWSVERALTTPRRKYPPRHGASHG